VYLFDFTRLSCQGALFESHSEFLPASGGPRPDLAPRCRLAPRSRSNRLRGLGTLGSSQPLRKFIGGPHPAQPTFHALSLGELRHLTRQWVSGSRPSSPPAYLLMQSHERCKRTLTAPGRCSRRSRTHTASGSVRSFQLGRRDRGWHPALQQLDRAIAAHTASTGRHRSGAAWVPGAGGAHGIRHGCTGAGR